MPNKNFESFLDEAKKEINKNKETALAAIGLFVEGAAIQLCPVRTGNLKGSITHKVDIDDSSVIIGTNVEYAIYIEKGTGIHAEGGKGRKTPWVYIDEQTGQRVLTSGSKAQPFLSPAVELNKDKIEGIVKKYMGM